MAQELNALLETYWAWLRDRTSVRDLDGWTEITSPFLDRHNDCLQIYVQREGGHLVMTDDGFTVNDLEMSGCSLDTPKRRELLRTALNGFGVKQSGDALEVRATEAEFPRKKHNLLQAMLAVNDLFYLATPTIASLFYEDVTEWLDASSVRYIPLVSFTGRSGFDHRFDFVIPKSAEHPERMLRAINRPDRRNAEQFAFAWIDTREARPAEARAYALLNDDARKVSSGALTAIAEYDIKPLLWSARNDFIDELGA